MLHASDARARLRAALDPDPRPEPAPGDRLAAVLAVLVEEPKPELVFVERSAHASRHPGEIAFPGGLRDPGEALVETALREASEETGLDPGSTEVLGALAPVHTSVSGILVTPFVGVVPALPDLKPHEAEIARVFTAGIARLAESESQVEFDDGGGESWRGWVYELDGTIVWGATGRMVHELLTILRKETSWVT
jgi:8-oxo-dGTP pyrophosphatase MutT (NUDIX family)